MLKIQISGEKRGFYTSKVTAFSFFIKRENRYLCLKNYIPYSTTEPGVRVAEWRRYMRAAIATHYPEYLDSYDTVVRTRMMNVIEIMKRVK